MSFKRVGGMPFRLWVLAPLLSALAAGALAEETVPDAEFWEWYGRYVNEEGEVFDPLDLKEINDLAGNGEVEATNQSEAAPAGAGSTQSQQNQSSRQQESSDETQGSDKP